jgi:hypothetical protein
MSSLTKEELREFQVDPIRAISKTLDMIEEDINDVMVVDASNPLMFILETIAFNASVLRDEQMTKHLRLYPKLANSNSDLYNNLSYKDTKNIFSQPAYCTIRFIINITNFNTVAETNVSNEYKMVSIPELSYISAEGYDFLVTNRIDIKQFNNGLFSIEQNVSSTDLGVSTLGVLNHFISTTEDGNRMLVFDTVLKQLTRSEVTITVNKTDIYNLKIPLTDRLHYISAVNKINGDGVKLEISYSEIMDPNIPTLLVKTLDNEIEITVPDVYVMNDLISGNVVVSIYTTKGVVDYPLNRLTSDKFSISYNGVEKDEYTAAISRVAIANTALERLNGGTNGKTFEELKRSIITNSIGDTISPVTSAQILDLVSRDGYYAYLLEDTITTRLYIASRTIPIEISNKTRNAKPDLLYYKTTIIPKDFVNHPMVIVSDTTDDRLIIKPYTIFRKGDGIILPLSVDEINNLNNIPNNELIAYLNENELLFSPYSYISSMLNNVYSLRIIDFRTKIEGFSILSNNTNILARSNISAYEISHTSTGYQIRIKLAVNSEFEKLNLARVKGQLRVNLSGNDNIGIYFYSHLVDGVFTFNINTDYYVDEELKLLITNGISDIATKSIDLSNRLELITYVVEPDVEANISSFSNTKVKNETEATTIITIEDIDVIFGTPIKQLHNNMTISYTDRKYKVYESNIVATYDEIVYDVDSIGSLLTPNEDLDDVSYTVLHDKGDPILDENGDFIILHREGDYILDEDGNPIIDRINGLVKYSDLLMLEYSLLKADQSAINDVIDSLEAYYLDMDVYRQTLLEETNIKFKPFINTNSIKINYNNSYKSINKNIKPSVELFIETRVSLTEEETVLLTNTIGSIIHNYLNKEVFYIADIKEDIKANVGFDVSAVRINLDRENDTVLSTMEKIVLADITNRLRINKIVSNSLGGINLLYDVDVIITKI